MAVYWSAIDDKESQHPSAPSTERYFSGSDLDNLRSGIARSRYDHLLHLIQTATVIQQDIKD